MPKVVYEKRRSGFASLSWSSGAPMLQRFFCGESGREKN
jgi:hypothetical protein